MLTLVKTFVLISCGLPAELVLVTVVMSVVASTVSKSESHDMTEAFCLTLKPTKKHI